MKPRKYHHPLSLRDIRYSLYKKTADISPHGIGFNTYDDVYEYMIETPPSNRIWVVVWEVLNDLF